MTAKNNPARAARPRQSAPPQSPRFVLDRHLFYLFGQALGRRDKSLAKALAPFDMTVPRWRILGSLHSNPGCSLTRLAELTAVDRTTAMRTVEGMRRDGLVVRDSDPLDKRSSVVSLNVKGNKLFERVYPVVFEHNQRAVRGLDRSEVEQFRRTLRHIIDNL
ncbi:MAG: MarR family transcriptional regulator [Betaproteobacteria bacterium]|nr:MarR family transcriptional regulator [Betaproteobacteria bacterium]